MPSELVWRQQTFGDLKFIVQKELITVTERLGRSPIFAVPQKR